MSPDEVRKAINSLKNSNSECKEGISNKLVKLSEDVLVLPLTYLVNVIIDKSEFPRIWKIYKTIGLYKGKGEKDSPTSYRPISLLSLLSKVIEKLLLKQMSNHMIENNLYNPRSYAYKEGQSTINALIDMMET